MLQTRIRKVTSFITDEFRIEKKKYICAVFPQLFLLLIPFGLRASSVRGAHVARLLFADCVRSSGGEYRGAQRSSSSGLTCLNWASTTRDYDVNIHPDSQTGKQPALICLFIQRSGEVPSLPTFSDF